MVQKLFHCDNYFQSYTRSNVIDTENANARNPYLKISLHKLDLLLGYHH